MANNLYQVTSSLCIVYKRPSYFGGILALVTKGTIIDVISISSSWAYFKYNGRNAYVNTSNLSEIVPTEPITGSITINYLDELTNTAIATSSVINDLKLGSYSYNSISIKGYSLISNASQSVTLTEESPNQVINFIYKKILGSVTIKYINQSLKTELLPSESYSNLELGIYSYNAKSISGFSLISNSTISIELTDSNPNQSITFEYNEMLGSVIVKYLDNDTSAEIFSSETFINLKLGSYTYTARTLDNYNISGQPSQTITLTSTSPKQTVTFSYSKVLGSVIIKYVDATLLAEIATSKFITGLTLGTYSYNSIAVSSYTVAGASTQSVTLTKATPNATITFKYNKNLGSVTVKYFDNTSKLAIADAVSYTNLEYGTYTYTSKVISGYNIVGYSSKSVTLSDSNQNPIIIFYYDAILGSVTIKYIDKDTQTDVLTAETYTNLPLGSYNYNAKAVDDYTLSDDSVKTVTLTSTMLNVTVTFKYSKILGSITINYVDSITGVELSPSSTISNLALGSYSYNAITIDGYNLVGSSSLSITLTDDNPNETISFTYSKILGIITIKYLNSCTLEELSPSTIISNISLGDYTYDAIVINGYEISGDSTISVILTSTEPNKTIEFMYDKVEANVINPETAYQVPYISTYYFKTKPRVDEDLIIPFYVTDYEQSEYLYDKDVKLDLLYQVDEEAEKVITISAGDNTVNLGKLSKGEHYFSLQALDTSTGLKSHRLYNEVLVIDDSYEITKEQTYIVTDADLSKYNLTKVDTTDETAMTNNRIGLTNLFADLQNRGYRKCILPSNGYFRIKKATGNDLDIRSGAIQIPSNFTVDMNRSTFKLHTNTGDIGNTNNIVDLIVRMYNCYDSHLINGILEGDRAERKALGLETGYKGEPISALQFIGGKYSSIENLTIRQTTGHTIVSAGGDRRGILGLSNTNFEKILIYEGKVYYETLWSTSQSIDLNTFTGGYLTVGRYLGYRGIRGNAIVVYYNFYDINNNFLKMVVGYQYRKTRIPSNSKYVRISFYGDLSQDTNVSMFYQELGTNNEIKNINFEDTRTCSIATTTSSGLLIDNVSFTRCGYSITPCPVDFEDGWQECQDIYFMNSKKIGNSVGTADIIDNSGYNHVYENNDNLGYTIRYSVVGLVIRNNPNMITSSWQRGYETGSKFGRVQNNTINGLFNSSTDDNDLREIVISLIKYSTINCTSLLNASTKTFAYKNCSIYKFNGNRVKAINTTIHPSPYLGDDFIFEKCTFYNFDNINTQIKFSFNKLDAIRIFTNCNFKSPTLLANHNNFNSGTFTNCIFEKDITINPKTSNKLGDLQFNNCTFKGNITIDIGNINCYIQFNNCSFIGNKIFNNYGQSNSIFK